MIEIKNEKVERAILVAVRTKDVPKETVEEHIDELELLADTAGAETVMKVIQDRQRIDSAFFIGKGKAEEIAELANLNDVSLIIFDEDLLPTQVRNLERLAERKILDRSGLILDIFASHAKTKQARTQVELAQLQYLLPRLTRAWTHLSKQYGGIGTKGPGETQIETDRRIIRTRIAKLKEKLKDIDAQDTTKSLRRKDFLTTSLVGYTNAGKSTLLNLLTDAGVLAEDKLFATLDSTTRSFELEKGKTVLMSDTVGFIRKLPHHLIASFKSTLNVVRDADVILHVIDLSHPFYEDHMKVVDETLSDLGCENKRQVRVFNKADAVRDKSRIDYVLANYTDAIVISAQKGMNIGKLKDMLVRIYEEDFGEKTVSVSINNSKIISQIHSLADVISTDYVDEKAEIKFRAGKENTSRIMRLVEKLNL